MLGSENLKQYLNLSFFCQIHHHKKTRKQENCYIACRNRISSYSFRGNYSFLNLEIQRYIRPKVTVRKGAETIQGRKLYEEVRYSESNVSVFKKHA